MIKVVFTLVFLGFGTLVFSQNIQVGATDTSRYFPLLKNKAIALVVNPTSRVYNQHLIAFLQDQEFNVKKIFALEHGVYGKLDAGEKVKNGFDARSGLPVISLYGSNKEPKQSDLKDIDVVVFDIQDVGARFYTYISSLHYIMEGIGKANKELVVLDRPNPNGRFVDGPILEKQHASFVGKHPIPVLHGMTIGEYALMINGEGWLNQAKMCSVTVIANRNYRREMLYTLPIAPSPNLPNDRSIALYPSLCFFEGTSVSVGRGTAFPFQVFGAPHLKGFNFSFTPKPGFGATKPKHNGSLCFGIDLREPSEGEDREGINLSWLISAYEASNQKESFFNSFFTLLAGGKSLQKQIEQQKSEEEIYDSWEKDLVAFKKMRKQYLLYP